jgi:hypothetical protein
MSVGVEKEAVGSARESGQKPDYYGKILNEQETSRKNKF